MPLFVKSNLKVIAVALVFIVMPFPVKFNNIALGILIGYVVFHYREHLANLRTPEVQRFLLLSLVLYLLFLIGLIHSNDLSYGMRKLETRTNLLLLPLLIAPLGLTHIEIQRILKFYVLGIVGLCIYCHVHAVIRMLEYSGVYSEVLTSYLYQTSYLTSPLELNPIYMSLYVSMAIFLCLWLGVIQSHHRVYLFVCGIYLQLFNILLISRTVLVSQFFLTIAIIAYCVIYQSRNKLKSSLVVLAAVVVIIFLAFQVGSRMSGFHHRFSDIFNKPGEPIGKDHSTSFHFKSWKCAFDSNKGADILWGQGSGDDFNILLDCYRTKGYLNMYEKQFNAHSEYLNIYLQQGLIGVCIFVVILWIHFYASVKKRVWIYTSFLLLFGLASVTESTFSVQKGVVFFAAFNSIFYQLLLLHEPNISD